MVNTTKPLTIPMLFSHHMKRQTIEQKREREGGKEGGSSYHTGSAYIWEGAGSCGRVLSLEQSHGRALNLSESIESVGEP